RPNADWIASKILRQMPAQRRLTMASSGNRNRDSHADHTPAHQRAAAPRHHRMVAIYGLLCLACVLGGIVAIIWNAVAKTEFSLFGMQMTAGHVGEAFIGIGVAFAGIGMFIGLLVNRALLKNQHDLARLPADPKASNPKA